VEAARARLAQAVVCAPVPGRVGSSVTTAGVVARAGDASPLVTITPPSPVTVDFAVPEQEIARLHEAADSGRVRVAAEPEDERARPVPGTLSWVAPSSDASTKTVRVRASFENADRTLHAGEPVRVTLVLAPSAETTVVPARAVQKGLEGTFVYVLEKDHTVQPRPVTTGPTVEELTVVEKGLEPGERVVIDNQRRLYAGARVEPKPS
jgi:multidrug efflux system membrane fusion protein